MRISITATVAAGVMIGTFFISSLVRADYAQESCEIGDNLNYVVIWVHDVSRIGDHRPLQYNVQFGAAGIVVRLPPEFYAPDWTQVDEIEMQFDDRASESGILQLRLHNTNGSRNSETISRVQRSCWDAVKKYVQERVEKKGTAIQMTETTGK